jgi:putative oxidoreductase
MTIDTSQMLWVLGRLLLGAYYAAAGVHHFSIIGPLTQAIVARGVPAARVVLVVGSAFQAAAGTALALGFCTPWAAFGLIVFTILASILLCNFWSLEGAPRESAIGTWKTNLALIGGLLIAAVR